MRGEKNELFLIVLIALSLSFVLAAHTITTSDGTTSYSINESIETVFNITVNNTDGAAAANISQVNITFPSNFTFIADTNGTNATGTGIIVNTTTVISWTSATYLINGSDLAYFWFNATVIPGTYNLTIETVNITGTYSTNISVEVNDTTNPTATIGVNQTNYFNSSLTNATFDIKCADSYSENDLVLYGNWSGAWHANQTNATAENDSYWNVSVTGIADGTYIWTAYCNDTIGNSDWDAANRTLTIDTTDPIASASCTPSTVNAGATTTCSCSGTDATSGVNTTTATSTPNTATTGTFTYNCTATDFARNSHTTSTTYTVTTDNVDEGGSTSSSTTNFWTKGTHTVSDTDFKKSFSKELSQKQRLKIKINSEYHYVGIIELTTTTAKINISSTPQQTTLTIGDEKKFDTNEDSYYDISLKLNSITNNKANITIQSINEIVIPEETISEQELLDQTQQQTQKTQKEKSSIIKWIIVTIITIAALLIIGIAYTKLKKKH